MILVQLLMLVSVGHACPTDCPATEKDDDGCCPEKALPKPAAPKPAAPKPAAPKPAAPKPANPSGTGKKSPPAPPAQAEAAPRPAPRSSVVAAHGAKIVVIPGGRSTLGCTPGAGACESDEKPSRTLVMHSFEMMDREVSQGLWEAVMGSNPMERRTTYPKGFFGDEVDPCNVFAGMNLVGAMLPVACIGWCDAVELANRLSRQDGYEEAELAYSGVDQCRVTAGASVRWNRRSDAWRLPTEQEWEHAARGGRDTDLGQLDLLELNPCSLGNVADREVRARLLGWRSTVACSDGVSGLSAVGNSRYPPNGYALRDMVGNVWEWTWDRYGIYPASSSGGYSGVDSPAERVNRGGSWLDLPGAARVANRGKDVPAYRGVDLGLRLVRGVPV